VRPVSWKELASLCEAEGCKLDRQWGDHYIMTKPGLSRPIVIPKKKDLAEDISLSVARTLGLTKKQLEQRLNLRPTRRSKAKTAEAQTQSTSPEVKPSTQV
jgi:predicted RNA binding protein YcfA (HicA-like mRNA interferase family)